MIPKNRPVLGMDVDELRKKLGLSVMDACWLFGLSMPKWSSVVNKNGSEKVPDVCLALMVRYLDEFPDSCPIDPAIPPADFYEAIQKINKRAPQEDQLPKEQVEDYAFTGALLGRDQSAGYRWIVQRGNTRPVIDHYIGIVNKDIRQGVSSLRYLRDIAVIEMNNRGNYEEAQALTYTAPEKEDDKKKKSK